MSMKFIKKFESYVNDKGELKDFNIDKDIPVTKKGKIFKEYEVEKEQLYNNYLTKIKLILANLDKSDVYKKEIHDKLHDIITDMVKELSDKSYVPDMLVNTAWELIINAWSYDVEYPTYEEFIYRLY